jgi:undecaprenyl pyrophosphate phosphatase UppP
VIPTLLVVAVVLGLLIHDRASLWRSVAVGAALAMVWGIVVAWATPVRRLRPAAPRLDWRTSLWAGQPVPP